MGKFESQKFEREFSRLCNELKNSLNSDFKAFAVNEVVRCLSSQHSSRFEKETEESLANCFFITLIHEKIDSFEKQYMNAAEFRRILDDKNYLIPIRVDLYDGNEKEMLVPFWANSITLARFIDLHLGNREWLGYNFLDKKNMAANGLPEKHNPNDD